MTQAPPRQRKTSKQRRAPSLLDRPKLSLRPSDPTPARVCCATSLIFSSLEVRAPLRKRLLIKREVKWLSFISNSPKRQPVQTMHSSRRAAASSGQRLKHMQSAASFRQWPMSSPHSARSVTTYASSSIVGKQEELKPEWGLDMTYSSDFASTSPRLRVQNSTQSHINF